MSHASSNAVFLNQGIEAGAPMSTATSPNVFKYGRKSATLEVYPDTGRVLVLDKDGTVIDEGNIFESPFAKRTDAHADYFINLKGRQSHSYAVWVNQNSTTVQPSSSRVQPRRGMTLATRPVSQSIQRTN